jgi:L-fucono-1,5-lactonase
VRIDSHQHFWKISRNDYPWMNPSDPILYRDYMPEDLAPHRAQHKIDRTILVQAAPTIAETDFLLDLAQKHDSVAGVVGWLPLDSPDFPEQFARYREKKKFASIRPMLQDLPEDDYILNPSVLKSLKLIAEHDFPFEFLTYTRHLPHVLQALEKVPNLHAVVDHISKPEIKVQKMEPWKSLIRRIAQNPNIYCKLSGMITEADHQHWTPGHLRPYVDHVVDCFGFARVMFGSDWPVCLLAGTYDRVIDALETILRPVLNPTSEAAVYGANAAKFYKIV